MIEVNNLTYVYSEGLPQESVAIEDVSFRINDGEFVGIIGHTGSGKSTLLQHLNGLLKPKSGSIIIEGNVSVWFFSTLNISCLKRQLPRMLPLVHRTLAFRAMR